MADILAWRRDYERVSEESSLEVALAKALAQRLRTRRAEVELTQEQVAECLKQARLAFLTKGLANGLHGMLPIAVAARVAHIRAPEPIAVTEEGDLLGTLHARLQGALDSLNRELAPSIDAYRLQNPLL